LAKPNYGFQKRQREISKQKKKEEKRKRKLEKDEAGDSAERFETAIADIEAALADLEAGSELYLLGTQLVANLKESHDELSLELAEGFLERVETSAS
jgi:hypothetical protein